MPDLGIKGMGVWLIEGRGTASKKVGTANKKGSRNNNILVVAVNRFDSFLWLALSIIGRRDPKLPIPC